MAISLQENIQTPKREDWRAFSPINASDPQGVIEPAQQHYARRRCKSHQLPGPFVTESSIFVQTNDEPGPGFDEIGSAATVRRPDSTNIFRIDFACWATDAEVRVTLYRLEEGGSTVQLSQDTESSNTATPSLLRISFTVTDSARRYDGLAASDVAPLFIDIEYRWLESTGERAATLETINLWETELTNVQIP